MSRRSEYRLRQASKLDALVERLKEDFELARQLGLSDLQDSLEVAARDAAYAAEDIREEANVE